MEKAFNLTGVVKRYPEFTLGPLDLDLEPGTVLGYIGPNGSGKTTTLQCISGLLRADAGNIEVFGRPNDLRDPEWKTNIGYVGDVHAFYEDWSARRNLEFLAGFYPNWSPSRAATLATRFELPLDKKARALSTGNRVKLSLVAALAHSPRLLLFDEPTSGLDPVVRAEVLDVLFEAVETGERAIFYSTHILSDLSRLADELAFIHEGKILERTAKDDLSDRWRRISFRLSGDTVAIDGEVRHHREGDDHHVVSKHWERTIGMLRDLGAVNIQEMRMSIDEIAVEIIREGKNGPKPSPSFIGGDHVVSRQS